MSEFEKLQENVRKTAPVTKDANGVPFKVHPLRSDIRYRLFVFRNAGDRAMPELIEHFERQFRKGWSWDNFSFVWDISPTDPLKAIPEREWLTEGGLAVDPREGEMFTAARFYPNGFTRQGR